MTNARELLRTCVLALADPILAGRRCQKGVPNNEKSRQPVAAKLFKINGG